MIPPPKTIPPTRMAQAYDGLTRRQVNAFGLVLSSSNMEYRAVQAPDGWQLWVPKEVENEAMTAITAYVSENNDHEEASSAPHWPVNRTWAGGWMALILLTVHLAIHASDQAVSIRRIFEASAVKILDGELYRITTALMLHGDGVHLAGNIAGMAIFATAVCSIAGFGAGSLMILLSGMGGNLINALMFRTGHHSIGASTAVFGAVGIVAAHQFIIKWQHSGQRLKAWLPLGGGLALLALLGAGINTDLTAHFFGYAAGCFIGIGFTSTRQAPPDRPAQYTCLLMAAILILASFLSPIVF